MIFRRSCKLISTLIGYGIGSAGAGVGAVFLATLCLSMIEIEPENNPIVPISGIGASGVVGIAGLRKMKRYATCSITEETRAIVRSRISWEQESTTRTNGNTQVTEYRNVPYTYLSLQGINGDFKVRRGYQGYNYATMRFYTIKTKTGPFIFDHDFIGVS